MTSKPQIQVTLKENNSKMKNLIGKRITKDFNFMGEKVKISKLTVSEVMEIQQQIKNTEGSDDDEAAGMGLIRKVIQMSCEDSKDLSDEDFQGFPIDELTKLSNEIMQFSGMRAEPGK